MAAAKVPVTVWFDREHLQRLRSTVRGMHELGHERVSLASMIDIGAVVVSQRLERAHHKGKRFPLIDDALPAGRRPK